MSNRSKGARLYLKAARTRGKYTEKAVWIIRDGAAQISTGCGADDLAGAERALEAHIAKKHGIRRYQGGDPLSTAVSDVIGLYARDVAPGHARPPETARRLTALLDHFGNDTLHAVTKSACMAYAKARKSDSAARRELQDFSAAINHYFAGTLLAPRVNIWLPEKSEPRPHVWTRNDVAKLLRAARKRNTMPGIGGDRMSRAHVARFILIGCYTGTRADTICRTAIRPTIGSPYVDLESGVYYRRPANEKETTKRRPSVPLPPRLLAHMRRWVRLGLVHRHFVEWDAQPVKRVTKAFARIVEECGLTGSPHTLRHTAITWAVMNGEPKDKVMKYFGVTERVMESTYIHYQPGYLASVGQAISRRAK